MPSLDPPFVEPLLGIVFDLDGTLINSRHDFAKMRRIVIALAEKDGVPANTLSPDDTVAGLMEKARTALAEAHAAEGTVLRFEAEANRRIDELELDALPTVSPRRGAAGLLRVLAGRGYRLGLLTRSSERFSRTALEQTGLAEFFPFLRTRSSPGPVKPSPEALRILLDEMGVPADRALVVGDHVLDAETAIGARVRFYAVLAEPPLSPNAPTSERLRAAGASAIASDLPELARQLGLPPLPQDPPAKPTGSDEG